MMLNRQHNFNFDYFGQNCYFQVNDCLLNGSYLFKYGNTTFYFFIVRKEVDKLDAHKITYIKNFRILYTEKGYSNNTIPNNKLKTEFLDNNECILIARGIDRSIRSTFPETEYRYDINVMLINYDNDDKILAASLGINIAMKCYFGNNIEMLFPCKLIFENDSSDGKIVYSKYINNFSYCSFLFNENGISSVSLSLNKPIDTYQLKSSIKNAISYANSYYKTLLEQINNMNYSNQIDHKLLNIKISDSHINSIYTLFCSFIKINNIRENRHIYANFASIIKNYLSNQVTDYKDTYIDLVIYKIFSNIFYKYYEEYGRLDNRKYTECRTLSLYCDCLVSRAVNINFKRGDSTVLTTCSIENKDFNKEKENIFYCYQCSSFASEEIVLFNKPVNRRNIGHANLIKTAISSVFKNNDYLMRFFVEVLSADGSTSLLGIMSCSLIAQLIDTSSAIVSGISFGLLFDGIKFILLSDITAIEDHFSTFDIKLAFDNLGNIVIIDIDAKENLLSPDNLFNIFEIGKKQVEQYNQVIVKWIDNNDFTISQMKQTLRNQFSESDINKQRKYYKKFN